jgi:hypothetical protein
MEIKEIISDCKAKEALKKGQQTPINKGLYAIVPYCIVEGTDLGLSLCFASPQKSDYFAISLKKLHVFSYNQILKNYKEAKSELARSN